MDLFATTVDVISDEVLRVLGVKDDIQSQMSNAEIITFTIIAAKYFAGNFKIARYRCMVRGLFPTILSHSRLNRRIHNIPWFCWNAIFRFLALIFKKTTKEHGFAVDSFPVFSCQKNRIDKKEHIFREKLFGLRCFKETLFLWDKSSYGCYKRRTPY